MFRTGSQCEDTLTKNIPGYNNHNWQQKKMYSYDTSITVFSNIVHLNKMSQFHIKKQQTVTLGGVVMQQVIISRPSGS